MEGDTIIQAYSCSEFNSFYIIALQNTAPTNLIGLKHLIDLTRDGEVCACCDGWLVLKEREILYLMNIHESSERIRLPSAKLDKTCCVLTGSPSNSSACRVLFMTRDTIWYCRPGDKNYKTYKLEEGLCMKGAMATVLEGKVYYVIENSHFERHNLAVIDFDGSDLQISRLECLPLPNCPEIGPYESYLIESGGKILLIFKAHLKFMPPKYPVVVSCFLVFQFDFLKKKWIKTHNIGDATIILPGPMKQRSNGISFRSTNPLIKPNTIHFLRPDDEYIHAYDLKGQAFYSLVGTGPENGNRHYEEENTEFLPQLPSHISKLVLGRLFTMDPGVLGVIRSVCKSWSRIIRPPSSDMTHIDIRYPFLVSLAYGRCEFFHPIYNHTFCLDTPELLGARIMFSRFGWLLLARYISELVEYFFYNPFTRAKKNLPDSAEFVTISFSSPPTSSDCFVVGDVGVAACVAIIKYGEEEWSYLVYSPTPCSKRIVSYHPVFYKQKCYFFGFNEDLVVIDLNSREVSVIVFSTNFFEFNGCFLVGDKEGLLGIFLPTEKRIPPHVMKMDLSQEKEWKPLENLNSTMVYVSPAASWSCSAPTKSTGNKLYFSLLRDSVTIFYSFSTKKYHSFEGHHYSCSDTPLNMQAMRNCCWFGFN